MGFCTNCGKKLDAKIKFCSECGNKNTHYGDIDNLDTQDNQNSTEDIICQFDGVYMSDGKYWTGTCDIGTVILTNSNLIFIPQMGTYAGGKPRVNEMSITWTNIKNIEQKGKGYSILLFFDYQLKNGKTREKMLIYVVSGVVLNNEPLSDKEYTMKLYEYIIDTWTKNK